MLTLFPTLCLQKSPPGPEWSLPLPLSACLWPRSLCKGNRGDSTEKMSLKAPFKKNIYTPVFVEVDRDGPSVKIGHYQKTMMFESGFAVAGVMHWRVCEYCIADCVWYISRNKRDHEPLGPGSSMIGGSFGGSCMLQSVPAQVASQVQVASLLHT